MVIGVLYSYHRSIWASSWTLDTSALYSGAPKPHWGFSHWLPSHFGLTLEWRVTNGLIFLIFVEGYTLHWLWSLCIGWWRKGKKLNSAFYFLKCLWHSLQNSVGVFLIPVCRKPKSNKKESTIDKCNILDKSQVIQHVNTLFDCIYMKLYSVQTNL